MYALNHRRSTPVFVFLKPALLCLALIVVRDPLFAGIPEPGIIVFGTVTDAISGRQVTYGSLQLVYEQGGTNFTNTVQLQNLAGGYSYVAEIGVETAVTNEPVSSAALALPPPSSTATNLTRHARFEGNLATLVQGTNSSLSHTSKGKLERLDVVVVGVETGGTGLPDWFRMQYWGTLAVNGFDDSDLDGMSNRDEYLAGTDPTNPSSLLALTLVQVSPTQYTVKWQSVAGKTYTVLRGTNLAGVFLPVASGLSASPPENVFQQSITNNLPAFFRVSTP
jgi:hypothetical protein